MASKKIPKNSYEKNLLCNNKTGKKLGGNLPVKPCSTSSRNLFKFGSQQSFYVKNEVKKGLINKTEAKERENPNESNIVTDLSITPKSLKQDPSNHKRWASVVKVQKKLSTDTTVSVKVSEGGDKLNITPEILNLVFKSFTKSLQSHKGYIVCNKNSFFCKICSVALDSVLDLSNHLKTRNHEDKVISFLASKLPVHLLYIMEFISFFGFNLCCNLCRCKIDMSAHNPYETIMNIISHNTDSGHANLKASDEASNNGYSLIKTLASTYPEMKGNEHYIEKEIKPEFWCRLCKTIIPNNVNLGVFAQNVLAHIQSVGHTKNKTAIEVLRIYEETKTTELGEANSYIILNGIIFCLYCNQPVEADLDKMMSHVESVEHSTDNMFSKMQIIPGVRKPQEGVNQAKSSVEDNLTKVISKESFPKVTNKSEQSSQSLAEDLVPFSGFEQVDYLIEKDKATVTCLICDCVVPSNPHNLQTHLLGNKHKVNAEKRSGDTNKDTLMDGAFLSSPASAEGYCLPDFSKLSLKDLNCLNASVNDSNIDIVCLVCNCSVSNSINKHFLSVQHKKYEKLLLNKSAENTSCVHDSDIINAIPLAIKSKQCQNIGKFPCSLTNSFYTLLLKRNSLVSDNKRFFNISLDGRNIYCRLCKSLMPITLNLDRLETSILKHMLGKVHQNQLLNQESLESVAIKQESSHSEGKVSRSLFLSGIKNENSTESNCSGTNQNNSLCSTTDEMNGISNTKQEVTQNDSSSQKNLNEEIFVFGKESDNGETKTCFEKSKSTWTVTPASGKARVVNRKKPTQNPKFEVEKDENVLKRRLKQIAYGKNTEGYARYVSLVPRHKRCPSHPMTPPRHLKLSRRTWDGLVKEWRKQLHAWDPSDPISTSVHSDIRPLTTQP